MSRKLMILAAIFAISLSCSCDPKQPAEPDAPATPDGLTLKTATQTTLAIQWNTVEGATGYEWQLMLGTGVSEVQTGTTSSRSVIIKDLVPETEYRFGVRSTNGSKSSGYSNYLTVKTLPHTDPIPVDPPGPTPTVTYSDFLIPSAEEDGKARAFPGAEGGGMWATGGRGGKVIHVTNLEDKGTGSLRAAIDEKGARTIVFDVAGIIELQSALNIKNGDVTIAGQTAPGDGICLKNYTLHIKASNVIIRYIRCRMGDEKKTEDDAMNLNAGSNDISNVIVDHCSLSWCTDECGSFYGMTGFTLQWCILSESLRNSIHDKGKHGYGGLWGGTDATYHHNLLAHHDSRNPRLDHDYLSTLKGPVNLANNVIYNWGDNSTYGGESANTENIYRRYNIVNNYYKPGPATAAGKVRFIDPWTGACSNCTKKTGCSTIVPGHFYMNGNYMEGNSGMSSDNWTGTTASAETIAAIKSTSAFSYSEKESMVSLQSATDAYNSVLSYAGASLKRDSVDERVCQEARKGNYTYEGSKGSSKGFIDTQSDVGGWPQYTCETESSFPEWMGEPNAYTLDPQKRYTNLEMYLHWLVREITSAQTGKGQYSKL